MARAKVFRADDVQAERMSETPNLPLEETEVTHQDEDRLFGPNRKSMADFLDILYSLSDEMFDHIKDERPPEEREGL